MRSGHRLFREARPSCSCCASRMQASFIDFLDHLKHTVRSHLTIRRYGDVLRDLAVFSGSAEPRAISSDALVRFASAPRHDGRARAPAGVNLRVAVLKGAFSFLADHGLVPTNPAARLV